MMNVSKRESGAALIIGLIFLVLMSVLGLTSMQGVTLQERITGNTADKFRAAQNAENVLLVAEENSSATGFSTTNTFIDSSAAMPDYTDVTLWSSCDDDTVADDEKCQNLLNAQVKYRSSGDKDTYFITVLATGNGTANVIVQSKYQGKPYEQQ
jgi:Tfp pilus assembly protein PilX